MFYKNKRIKLDRLFNLQYQEKSDDIRKRYSKILLSQAEEANRLDYLHDGKYASMFLKTYVDKSTEMLKELCDTFKSVYFENGIKSKYLKLLHIRILGFSINIIKSFNSAVDSNSSIFPSAKDSLKIYYKANMGTVVAAQIRSIEIEYLKGNRFKNIINEIGAEVPSNLKYIKWLMLEWRNHKFFVVIFTIIILILLLYPSEIKDNLKSWINTAINSYF